MMLIPAGFAFAAGIAAFYLFPEWTLPWAFAESPNWVLALVVLIVGIKCSSTACFHKIFPIALFHKIPPTPLFQRGAFRSLLFQRGAFWSCLFQKWAFFGCFLQKARLKIPLKKATANHSSLENITSNHSSLENAAPKNLSLKNETLKDFPLKKTHQSPPLKKGGWGDLSIDSWWNFRTFFIIPLLALLGFSWAQFQASDLLHHPFPAALARAPLLLDGRIASIPIRASYGTRFQFDVSAATHDGQPLPFQGQVRLIWYQAAPALAAGERWRLPVRLKPRHSTANPGGVDGERVLFERGIKATGSVRAGGERLDASAGSYWLQRWRQRIAAHLTQEVGATDPRGMVVALVLGETGSLTPDDWEVLTLTGTSHLIAISGFNIGMIAVVLIGATRWLWRRSAWLTQRLATPRAGAVVGMMAALGYAGLAGFSISTQRALIMLLVVLSALFWQRTLRPYHGLMLAAIGVFIIDSKVILSFGFWLSFGAVALLLFHLGQRLPRRDLWTQIGRAQWAVTLGLLPLLLALFGRVSLIAPLVNVIAVPLFSLLLPLALSVSLLSVIPAATAPLRWTAQLLNSGMDGLAWLAQWSEIAATLPTIPHWALAVATLGAVLLLAPRGVPGRWLGVILLLPLVTTRPPQPAWGEVWVTVLDVGQGLAVVAQTAAGTLIFDTGPGKAGSYSAGRAIVAPFLLAQGITQVERVLISHADQDHAGGLAELALRVRLMQVQSGEPLRLNFAGATRCAAGERWQWAGVSFQVLHPAATAAEVGNNSSCVLRIEAGGRSLLLTGDADQGIERELVRQFGAGLKSTVLVAGHHGSNTSSAAVFLNAVAPSWVLFSAGFANHFNFPTKAVQERIAARGIQTLNTATAGAIQFRFNANGQFESPTGWREKVRRRW
jgi:competence protein ComEC